MATITSRMKEERERLTTNKNNDSYVIKCSIFGIVIASRDRKRQIQRDADDGRANVGSHDCPSRSFGRAPFSTLRWKSNCQIPPHRQSYGQPDADCVEDLKT